MLFFVVLYFFILFSKSCANQFLIPHSSLLIPHSSLNKSNAVSADLLHVITYYSKRGAKPITYRLLIISRLSAYGTPLQNQKKSKNFRCV